MRDSSTLAADAYDPQRGDQGRLEAHIGSRSPRACARPPTGSSCDSFARREIRTRSRRASFATRPRVSLDGTYLEMFRERAARGRESAGSGGGGAGRARLVAVLTEPPTRGGGATSRASRNPGVPIRPRRRAIRSSRSGCDQGDRPPAQRHSLYVIPPTSWPLRGPAASTCTGPLPSTRPARPSGRSTRREPYAVTVHGMEPGTTPVHRL